ncbi:MAG: isocitrate dehydrogenase kinase/phosphatase AceK regulatory subunit, partial [Betaproteobacteria bacterium]
MNTRAAAAPAPAPHVLAEAVSSRFDRSMPQPAAIARAILDGFDHHYRLFRYVAQQAKSRFEHGDWQAMR